MRTLRQHERRRPAAPPRREEAAARFVSGPSGEIGAVLRLQRLLGNARVQRMLAPAADGAPLQVSAADAPEEREAEAAAERAVAELPGAGAPVRRSAEGGEAPAGGTEAVRAFLASSTGAPLEGGTRAFMEERLGRDFGGVRVHTGPAAGASARAIGAAAYTLGSDIVFGEGRYRPDTRAGRRLIAHELAHVAQDAGRTVRRVRRASINQYVDNDPLHDPSRLSDSAIQATDEYQDFSTYTFPPLVVPYATPAEALLAARLYLRFLREGNSIVPWSWRTITHRFIDQAKRQLGVLTEAQAQVGHLNWVPFSTTAAVQNPSQLPTEFGRWVLANGPEPSHLSGSVNCWEMVLFGAYKGGYLSFSRIQQIYTRAVDNVRQGRARLVGETVESELRGGAENVYDPANPDTPRPLAGDVVIFREAANHVAIALGTQNQAGEVEVLSLWAQPGNISQVQRTTIEALLAVTGPGGRPVKFWSARW